MKVQHRQFADEILSNGGDHIAAYLKVYKSKDRKTAATRANQVLKIVEVAKYIENKGQKMTAAVEKKTTERLSKAKAVQTLTFASKRSMIFKMAQKVQRMPPKMISPAHISALARLMQVDNAMMGHNAKEEKHHSGEITTTVVHKEPLPDDKFAELLKAINDKASAG